MTTLLIASFSNLANDARLLRQIRAFSRDYDVTTLGYGPKPEGVARHLQIPDEATNVIDGRLITLKAYRLAVWSMQGVQQAKRLLAEESFDVALANDLYMLPIVTQARTKTGWHADLHEYFPRLHDNNDKWRKRIGPFYSWIIRIYARGAESFTTVSEGLAEEYARTFGFDVDVVTNATDFHELKPGEVGEPIRAVHTGAALAARGLEVMIEAFRGISPDRLTFDLYLTNNDPAYVKRLEELSGEIAAVTVREPVPYEDLLSTLNDYDVGIHILQPVNFNHANALPNKIFDFVQARLGLIIGPSREMLRIVEGFDVGAVTEGFAAEDLTKVLMNMTRDDVVRWKSHSHEHAQRLSGHDGEGVWRMKIAEIVDRAR